LLGLVGKKIKNRIWANEEIELLEIFHKDGISLEEMAVKLNRDVSAVKLKSKPIRGENLFWKEEDLDIVRNNYSSLPQKELEALLPNKSWVSICHKSRELGLSRPLKLLWKEEELSLLVGNYSTMTIRELVEILPNKSKVQINSKAKCLGLIKNKKTLTKCLRLKHDIDFENISFSHDKINSWRRKIIKRDDYICQECGMIDKTGQELHAHHIIPQRDCDEDKKHDISNGITLCIECHKKTINKEYKYANKYLSLVK
jgi:5-methylcytosine-specific restriction endonuclease McrA